MTARPHRTALRRFAPAALAPLLLLLALPGLAAGVYQWKDAKGVTHYSDSPPPDQGYRNRAMKQDVPAPVAATAAKPAPNPQCEQARRNLELLKGSAPVNLDANGDGKPDAELSAEQRASQAQLAEAVLKANCSTPATAKTGG